MGKHFYIHIPFCVNKCQYCSFYSVKPDSDEILALYKDAVIKEIRLALDSDFYKYYEEDDMTDTIYVGGGTPSIMKAEYLIEIIDTIKSSFNLGLNSEITVEVNPFTVDYEKLKKLREGGFNRISIGVQSLNDDVLKTLGRLHDSKRAVDAINWAIKAGFSNISADLIIGVPGQTVEGVLRDTKDLYSLGITHLSTYSLSIEEGTPFEKLYKNLSDFVDEDEERLMYHGLRKLLRDNGFINYEISNSSLEGFESRHNSCYWKGSEYYAFGSGAHGFVNSKRFSHGESYKDYIRTMNKENITFDDIVTIEEVLSQEDKMREYMMLSFRTQKGVDLTFFNKKFGKSAKEVFKTELENLVNKGLIEEYDGGYRYTLDGLNLANIIFEEFV